MGGFFVPIKHLNRHPSPFLAPIRLTASKFNLFTTKKCKNHYFNADKTTFSFTAMKLLSSVKVAKQPLGYVDHYQAATIGSMTVSI